MKMRKDLLVAKNHQEQKDLKDGVGELGWGWDGVL